MTREQRSGLARLMLRFPNLRDDLRRTSATPSIADLCESYEQAWQAALFWAGEPGQQTADIAADFRQLILAIEEEVLQTAEAA